MDKSENNIARSRHDVVSAEKRIAKARAEYRRESARLMTYLYLAVLFFVAAVALWVVSHGAFEVAFVKDYVADSREFHVMNMWNVLMYFIPGMFAALSTGCLAVAIVFEVLGMSCLFITVLWQKCRIYRQARLSREAA
ncbi:hypothetical protein OHN11_21495 [Serratia marcescens]|uniref:hypothetical protein n=1 Tax=Serratia TaxID=613 RepID=UPI0006ACBB68|nr:hypothetical protein [Serratia marcescens]MDM3535863.1 hypothetical protein [Serratia marcescens]